MNTSFENLVYKLFVIGLLMMSIGQIGLAQSLGFELNERYEKETFSFEYINGFIIVEVLYNHTFPMKFIFDTGASNTIVNNKTIVDLFSPDYGRTFTIYGADLSQPLYAHLVKGIHLKTGNVAAPNQDILVLEEDYFNFESLAGTEIHGILGADMFRNHIVKINYQRRTIQLYRNNTNKLKTNDFQKSPIVIQKSKPYIVSNITLSNNTEAKLKLLVDTGASAALLINTKSDSSLVLPKQIIPGNLGFGIGGLMEGYVGRIRDMELGGKNLENVICHFQNNQESFDSLNIVFRHGLIGNLVLDRFEIIINYPKQELYLKPSKKWKRKFVYDKSGITVIAIGIGDQTFYINNVLKNSPAEKVGLKIGDVIRRINMKPHLLLSHDGITDILRGKTGKKIKLKVKRGDEILKFEFRLKDLI